MIRMLVIVISLVWLQACSNNGGESGAVNDGIKAVDSNGAFPDTAPLPMSPSIDTQKGEHRVDLERRDSTTIPQRPTH